MRLVLSLAVAFWSFAVSAQTALEKAGLESFVWKTGQVIGISEMIADPTTFFFEAVTGSRFGHTGIVVVQGNNVLVYQADPKLKGTGFESIESFIARAENGRGAYDYTIAEATLTPAMESKLVKAVDKLVAKKIPYNFSQVYDPRGKSLNCSEFVALAFQKAGLKNVGEVQGVQEAINVTAMNGRVKELATQFGGNIPQPTDKVLTPLSVMKSPALTVLKTTIPLDHVLSDAEVYKVWEGNDGFLSLVAYMNAVFSGSDPAQAFHQAKADPNIRAALQPQVDAIQNQLSCKDPTKTQTCSDALSSQPFRTFPSNWRKD